jgi:hypothetical protein
MRWPGRKAQPAIKHYRFHGVGRPILTVAQCHGVDCLDCAANKCVLCTMSSKESYVTVLWAHWKRKRQLNNKIGRINRRPDVRSSGILRCFMRPAVLVRRGGSSCTLAIGEIQWRGNTKNQNNHLPRSVMTFPDPIWNLLPSFLDLETQLGVGLDCRHPCLCHTAQSGWLSRCHSTSSLQKTG